MSDSERWSFTLTDGTELQPQDGRTYLLCREQAKEIRERYFSFVEAELKKK